MSVCGCSSVLTNPTNGSAVQILELVALELQADRKLKSGSRSCRDPKLAAGGLRSYTFSRHTAAQCVQETSLKMTSAGASITQLHDGYLGGLTGMDGDQPELLNKHLFSVNSVNVDGWRCRGSRHRHQRLRRHTHTHACSFPILRTSLSDANEVHGRMLTYLAIKSISRSKHSEAKS